MKRKNIYIIITVVLLIALFFPFSSETHVDGTKEYSALMMKYVNWASTESIGTNIVEARTFKMYFFPDNLKEYEELRNEFFYDR